MNQQEKQLKPLALYVHIPFCVQKCLYCDFLSFSSDDMEKEKYIQSLLQEIQVWQEQLYGSYYIKTVFWGGGTPTCLTVKQLAVLGEAICKMCWKLQQAHGKNGQVVEYTVEANPGTVCREKLAVLQNVGVNRISMGLQSAQGKELQALGRIHTYSEFLRSYDLLRESGIENINVDLMKDIPGQTLSSYQDTLEKVTALHPQHISSYSLIVEEGTPFYEMQQRHTLQLPDEETDFQLDQITRKLLLQKGYQRYEISNYACNGLECIHNTGYWKLEEYLGIGLGASSYLAGYRFKNTVFLKEYYCTWSGGLRNIPDFFQDAVSFAQKKQLQELHKMTKKEEMEEYVFLGFRRMRGISKKAYQERFGEEFDRIYEQVLPPLFKKKLLAEDTKRDRIYLTCRGIDVSNRVLAEFLL